MKPSFFLKLIPLAFLLVIMSLYLPSYADVIPTNFNSISKTAETTVGYDEFKEKITHSTKNYKNNKPITPKDKQAFINTFKKQLAKCNYFKNEVDNNLKRIDQLKANEAKKQEDYIKNNPPPTPSDNPDDPTLMWYYKYDVPNGFDYTDEINSLYKTKTTISEDIKLLKQYLRELGVKDFSLPDQKELLLKNLVIISLFILFLLFMGFNTLKYIRGKKSLKTN